MSYKADFEKIYGVVDSHKVFSDHEHHHPDGFFAKEVDLATLIANSYLIWMTDHDMGKILADKAAFADTLRYNSYYHWLEKGLQKLYGCQERLDTGSWDKYDKLIRDAHRDPNFHWQSLLKSGYDAIIVDAYWDPGNNGGHSEIFKATFRVDKLTYGHHSRAHALEGGPLHDPSLLYPWKRYGFAGGTLDDYVAMAQEHIATLYKEKKIVALKSAIAYDRTIDFYPDDKALALRAWGKTPEEITPEEFQYFGNYIFHRCFEVARKYDIPVQIHTGLAKLSGSNPMLIERLLTDYSDVRFVLFHSGYPWTSQAAALSHNHRNAFPNLTWTPIISTAAAVRTLDEFIDVSPSINIITWGSDSWLPEESVGAQLAWKHVVATVLCNRFRNGLLDASDVDILAEKLMLRNGRHVYLEHGW